MIRVRLKNDPTRLGTLTGKEQLRRNRKIQQVQFSDGVKWIPEEQLEVVQHIRMSPLDMLETKKLGRPIDLRRILTHVKLSGSLADVIYSMEATNTDFYAYQFKPVIKMLESPTNGILIADEVGLGKTIEAGLIWTELRSRFDMTRLMILCPAALREKWQRELSIKFNVAAQICDPREALQVLKNSAQKTKGFAIICSVQGFRPPKGWNEVTNKRSSAKLARYLQDMENEDRIVDLLVIDEAHHMRNIETQTHEIGRLCRNVSEHKVLLSATPIHNKNDDLFSLLRLLDPDTFSNPYAFERILEANKPLLKARDLLLSGNVHADMIVDLLSVASQHHLLRNNRQLELISNSGVSEEQLSSRDFRSHLAYRLETANLLAHVVTRTRKRDVTEWKVLREPTPEFVDLKPVERRFYDLVSDVVTEYALKRDANERFLLAQPQRQMTSSMAASLREWQRKLIELEESEESGEIESYEMRRESLGPLVTEIVRRARDYADLEDLIKCDSKYNRLIEILTAFLDKYPNEKIVLFSAFRATLKYLEERLSAEGISCAVLMGGQSETKDDIIQRFRLAVGPSILLSSEVGGEGVDLQFCRVVINYDLPWNPMRLEQRIGRIDRLGQQAKSVTIWNILYSRTIDARIYRLLYEKLDLCRNAMGDFEAILGDEVRKLEIDLLSEQLSEEQQEKRIDQTAQALINIKQLEEKLEEDAASLVAHGDYILSQVKAARDLNRWISGEDLRRYVFDYLQLNYQGCHLHQLAPDSDIFEIGLSIKAKSDLEEFIRHHRLSTFTNLVSSTMTKVRCRFSNKIGISTDWKDEIISQFHPLIRMISNYIVAGEEQLTPAVSFSVNRQNELPNLQAGVYILCISLWTFKGLQNTEKLAYAAAPLLSHGELLDSKDAEILAAIGVENGNDWLEVSTKVDLDLAYLVANDRLFGDLDEKYETFISELNAKNEDRADIQLRNLDHHYENQLLKLKDTLESHEIYGRQSLVKATEGRIKALTSRVEVQREKINARRKIVSHSSEIAIAIINLK